jgi:hypothetical protein
MKLSYFSVNVSYDGSLRGVIQFVGEPTSVTHTLSREQTTQLSDLIEKWKAQLLVEAASKLIQASDDVSAIEHVGRLPTLTNSEVNDSDIPF